MTSRGFQVANLDAENPSTNAVSTREQGQFGVFVSDEPSLTSSSWKVLRIFMMLDYQYFPPRRKIKWAVLFMVCASGALVTLRLVKPGIHEQSNDSWASNDLTVASPSAPSRQTPQGNHHRRNVVRQMMKFAWDKYTQYAWGYNELRPMSKTGFAGGAPYGGDRLGLTIVDSLDTLFLMGLEEELAAGLDWVKEKFSFRNTNSQFSVFETNIRFLGGFLSAHALTKNKVYMEKAVEVGDVLMHALQSPSGLPYSLYDYSKRRGSLYSWAPAECVFLADAGTLHLEFAYLSEITGNRSYSDAVNRVRKVLRNSRTEKGFYPNHVDFLNKTGKACRDYSVSVGAFGDSFYEYLLKQWFLSGKTDTEAKGMFDRALKTLEHHFLRTSKAGYMYFAKLEQSRQIVDSMEHLACFIGGLYALAADVSKDPPRFRRLAKEITKTCRTTYSTTRTGLGPENFMINENGEPVAQPGSHQYILRPEVVESYYYLWKTTGDDTYREWAWEAVQAIERYCKKADGYTGIPDVEEDSVAQSDDMQQSFFMAETLKYLYLIFLDEDPVPLESWVYNTEAHPLPVIGSEPYREAFLAWRGQPYLAPTIEGKAGPTDLHFPALFGTDSAVRFRLPWSLLMFVLSVVFLRPDNLPNIL